MVTAKVIRSTTKRALWRARDWVAPLLRLIEHGDEHYCPCCESSVRRFKPYGVVRRKNAKCGVCGALERDRLLILFIRNKTDLNDGRPKRVLHIAPEPSFTRLFRTAANVDYLSGDLMDVGAMVKMDITDIQCPDDSFDVIYCSHVLEHVPDDRRAMRELLRVLRPEGWAILQVPIDDATFEDPSITDPKERERVFGQHDHVRRYGPDYADRLRDAGFAVQVIDYVEALGDDQTAKFGLARDERIYFCRKPRLRSPDAN